MARYEYLCRSCGHRFERTERISEHESGSRPVCPSCKGRRTRQVMSRFFAETSRKS